MIKGGKKNIKRKLWNNMGSENKKLIIPYRYMPFDIGTSISDALKNKLIKYFDDNHYKLIDETQLLTAFSKYYLFGYKLSDDISVYIYSFGVGVFLFKGDEFVCSHEKYAFDYCKERKEKYASQLNSKPSHKFSPVFDKVANDLRSIVKENSSSKQHIRTSANCDWECAGFSYIMSTSFIVDSETKNFEFKNLNEDYKKNLLIILEPAIANLEESNKLSVTANNDPFNFSTEDYDYKNWLKKSNSAVYISWSAVVVLMDKLDEGIIEHINCMEIDLQAMWLYSYCLYNDASEMESKNSKVSALKNELFKYKKMYTEFKANADSNLPEYIFNIRNELIKTSFIDEQYQRYTDYLQFRIEETESKNIEEQQKFNVLSEILLFVIAYIQIVPSLYGLLMGEFKNIGVPQVIILALLGLVGIILIVRKDKL